jgi:hypothetical protein
MAASFLVAQFKAPASLKFGQLVPVVCHGTSYMKMKEERK